MEGSVARADASTEQVLAAAPRPPKKALLARAKEDKAANRLHSEPNPERPSSKPRILFQAGHCKTAVVQHIEDPELLQMLDNQYEYFASLEEEDRRRIAEGMRVKVERAPTSKSTNPSHISDQRGRLALEEARKAPAKNQI